MKKSSEQNNLFVAEEKQKNKEGAPLAEKLRPATLDEMIGQAALLGEGGPIRLLYESGILHSMILWGPPGVGKTTLARILAEKSEARFLTISAVFSGIKDIRSAIEEAEKARLEGERTVLFVDEVHRFNKAQQDAFLPHVESGLIILIGATTENPSFEVNSALLSRASVYILQPLEEADLEKLAKRALSLPLYQGIEIPEAVLKEVVVSADGDGRQLLNRLEQLLNAAKKENTSRIDSTLVARVLSAPMRRFDKGGEMFYDEISALHKSVRGSHPNAALYWFCRMLDGGADPLYLARRIIRMAWEDIGLADPRGLSIAGEAARTYERLGSPEGELALAEAVIYLSCAPKSNASEIAYNRARAMVKKGSSAPVPLHLRNAPTRLMKDLNYAREYRYAHDEENAYAAGEDYMPDGMEEPSFYEPTPYGLESKIQEKLARLKEWDKVYREKKHSKK